MDKTVLSGDQKQTVGADFGRSEELEQLVRIRTAELEEEILQRKQAEERLIRQQEFNHALLESMADGVVACDAEGTLTLFNRSAKEWHGMDPMRLPPDEWAKHYDLFRSDGITPLSTEEIPLARAFKGESVVDAGMAIVARGQTPRFILANGSVIRDETGTNLGAVVTMRDVTELRRVEEALRKANEELESAVAARTSELEATLEHLRIELEERKRAEDALEKERKRMDVILSALNTGLSLINPDMTIAWVNQKIREMFPGREPVGQVCHVFYEARATICDGCGTVRAFMDGNVWESEQLVPANGRWYYIISQPIKDSSGRVVNVLEGITDITERKQVEEAIHLQAAELEQEVAERQMVQENLQEKALQLEEEIELRQKAQEELEKLNRELEQRVQQRTAELAVKNTELEKMNKLFVGRELKMVELKERVRELENLH